MDHVINQSEIASLRKQRLLLYVLSVGLLLINGVLALGLLHKDHWVVLSPPKMTEPMSFSAHEVSDSYLIQMSEFFLDLRFNKTPTNAKQQSQQLLHYVAPRGFEVLSQRLALEDERYQKDNIHSSFYPTRFKVAKDPLRVEVEGVFESFLRDKPLKQQHASYVLVFDYQVGHLTIVQLHQLNTEKAS